MTDIDLIERLKSLVGQERELLIEVLRHLREVETRKLYLARGYSSMFAFCLQALGYSEAEAHTRIQAVRLIKTMPFVESKIADGELSLSVAARAQACFRRHQITYEEKLNIITELLGCTTRAAERKLAAHFPEQSPREVERPISAELTRIEFTVTNEQLAKFQRLKELMAHKNFEGRYDLLFEELADIALKQFDAPVLGTRKVQRRRSRYIPPATRKQVRRKAGDRCEYVDPQSGRRCDSTHGLQIDHIVEYARGGSNKIENLRLLCGAHNRWRQSIAGPSDSS